MQSIEPLLKKTKSASHALQQASAKQILTALKAIASTLESDQKALLHANRKDVEKQDPKSPRIDRLLLNEQRIMQMANAIRTIGRLPDPSGKLLEERTLSNGLLLQKQTAPLGVVGAIYESRPNVTFDIAALCLRSRNACLLKGSSEAENTNKAALHIIHRALRSADLPSATVTLLPVAREVLTEMFTATRYLDVIIPRGSEGLIQYVRKNSLVPVIETGAGVCHVYVEARANLDKALAIAVNAKVSRPSVCNAMDTLLVDKTIAPHFLQRLAPEFGKHKVEIFAAPDAYRLLKGYPYLHKAVAEDFGREYLSLRCSLKIVDNIDEALQHIEQFSTRHSEAIVSESRKQCDRFVREVDAAVVYTNASTRFTDGEEFGLGAEIGISTQKLHARGPFALEKLVTEKWVVRGSGQVR